MATSDTAPDVLDDPLDGDPRPSEGRIGIDHLTVVPENFDPEMDPVDE